MQCVAPSCERLQYFWLSMYDWNCRRQYCWKDCDTVYPQFSKVVYA